MNGLTTTQAATPAPTLEVLTLEVKFYLNQTAQNIIEVGKRLIQAKELVPHGEWGQWLEKNFSLSQPSASRFMRCAQRFANYSTLNNFNSSQLITMLELPEAETEQFIAEKASEGKPVEDMTIRQMREEIQQWKSRAEVNENALNAKQRELEQSKQKVGKIAQDYNAIQSVKSLLERQLKDAQNQLRNQKPIIQVPADYDQIKHEVENLRNERTYLRKKLDAAAKEVKVPDDYHASKKRLAELDAKIAGMQKTIDAQAAAAKDQINVEDYALVAQKLDTIYALISDIISSPNVGRVVADYARNDRTRYALLCASFNDFMNAMKMR